MKIWDGTHSQFEKHRFAIIGENDVICVRDEEGNVRVNMAFVKQKKPFVNGIWNPPRAVEMKGLLIVWSE